VYQIADTFVHRASVPQSKFGYGTRFYSPELGGNNAGPLLGPMFDKIMAGALSPGPAAYRIKSGKGIQKSMGDAPTHVIGTSKRSSVAASSSTWVPGPGTYFPKKVPESTGGRGPFNNPPSFSVASCIRSEVAPPASGVSPGPAAYEVSTGLSKPDMRKKAAPAFHFGKDTDRSSFLSRHVARNPGPGEYDRVVDRKGNANIDRPLSPTAGPRSPTKGFSFGGAVKKHGPEEGRGSTHREHLSTQHAEEHKGTLGPSSSEYDVRPISFNKSRALTDAPSVKFGTGKRGNSKQFISNVHSQADNAGNEDGGGPASYSVEASTKGRHSKFREGGFVKFGNAKRMDDGAAVRF